MTRSDEVVTKYGLDVIGPRQRLRPTVGSVFTYQIRGRMLFGRVIEDGLLGQRFTFGGEPMDTPPLLLIYAYTPAVRVLRTASTLRDFIPPDLLIPPCIMNTTGWRDGVFRTVGGRELRDGEVLAAHRFWNVRGFWVDQYDSPVEAPPGLLSETEARPILGVSGYGYLADAVSQALEGWS